MTTKDTKNLHKFDLINVDILVITDNDDTNDMVVVMKETDAKTFLKCLLSWTICPSPYRKISHVHTGIWSLLNIERNTFAVQDKYFFTI